MPYSTYFSTALVAFALAVSSARAAWEPVPPVDWSKISIDQFADDELEIPYLLQHFAQVANAVVEEGPNRGFLAISVNRRPQDNQPYNARVMETAANVAYFYTADRPWNPYRGHPAVRVRLEAMLDYWCRIQREDGWFAEYFEGDYNLPATGFGILSMAHTLGFLHDGPPIDADILRRTTEAQKKAILAMVGTDTLVRHGRNAANQYTGIYTAAPYFVRLHPETRDEIMAPLVEKMDYVAKNYQSPAGFLYEVNGPDFAYSFGTHVFCINAAWFLAKDSPIADHLIEETRRLFDPWGAYNLVLQPDGSGYFTNFGVTTRTGMNFTAHAYTPLAEHIPIARAFSQTTDEHTAALAAKRAKLAASWGRWDPLVVPSPGSYTNTHIAGADRAPWRPTKEQRDAARAELPYQKTDRFTTRLADDRFPLACTFVRRPGYYASLNTGTVKVPERQRFGLGLVWNERLGAVLQTQAESNTAAWGTRIKPEGPVEEARAVEAAVTIDGSEQPLTPGKTELPNGPVVARYAIGSGGTKTITFDDAGIAVAVTHAAPYTEILPLLLRPDESLDAAPGRLALTRDGTTFEITFDLSDQPTVTPTDKIIGGRRLVVIELPSTRETLEYRLAFR